MISALKMAQDVGSLGTCAVEKGTISIVFGKTRETDDNSGLTTKLVTLLQVGGNKSMFYGENHGTRPGDSNERL